MGGYTSLLSKLADQGVLGVVLALAILAIIFLFKKLNDEKDKELAEKDEILEKVTLVLRAIDNTEKAILIDLETRHEKK